VAQDERSACTTTGKADNAAMARVGNDGKNNKNNKGKKESSTRGERLAAALRENLHRRKAQERGRASPATDTTKNGSRVPPDDSDH